LIKYIKSVLWRVEKRLSYTEEARCLKVNIVVPRRDNSILFYFISFLCISHMLLALQETVRYISQSDEQEGRITCHSHSNSKLLKTAQNCC